MHRSRRTVGCAQEGRGGGGGGVGGGGGCKEVRWGVVMYVVRIYQTQTNANRRSLPSLLKYTDVSKLLFVEFHRLGAFIMANPSCTFI